MWQNNSGFGGNAPFQNNFNQDSYPPGQQQYFAQHPDVMQYEDVNGDAFQPEVGIFNDGSYSQNQFINAGAPHLPLGLPVSQPVAPTPRPLTQINARAAELKAKLLKNLEGQASSANPPVNPKSSSTAAAIQATQSPKIPTATAKKEGQDLSELILQYSQPTLSPAASVKQENNDTNASSIRRIPVHMGGKLQAPALASPKTNNNGGNTTGDVGKQMGNNTKARTPGNRHTSNGSVSDGEILEEREPKSRETTAAVRKLNEAQASVNISKADEPASHRARDEQTNKPNTRPFREASLPVRPPPANVQRNRNDQKDDKRAQQPDDKNERKKYPDCERPANPRLDEKEEDRRRPESSEQRREDVVNKSVREQKPPTLTDVLPNDEDLREWLEITGYHNAPYRSKILNRRRAIAALDAQRDQLLAEMELDERGGLPVVAGGQVPPSSMLPPPIPNKVGGRAESVATPSGEPSSDPQRDRVASNKRRYSDVSDSRGEINGGGKLARTDDRGYQSERIKDEHGPRSSGFEASRRSPPMNREREARRLRYESRGRSRDRDSSPGSGRRAYESRPPARGRLHDSDYFYDREDVPVYEHRGNYRGYAYDPSYRSRGRGRGDSRDGGDFDQYAEFMKDTGFGSKIANGKPFKDHNGFDRGGRGDTRYFIVKSFNQENVLRCIQDSVWTTQIQNGATFKKAFETCKNVILVFSINKSRAFQGYARMESLPGSVGVPEWQRSIHWESTGPFRVRWLVVCSTRFQRVGHLKNALNDNLAVLIGKDGQEIEENCGAGLIELIDEEASLALRYGHGHGHGRGQGRDYHGNQHDGGIWDGHY